MVYDALAGDSDARELDFRRSFAELELMAWFFLFGEATDLILTRARALEAFVWLQNPDGNKNYRDKIRSLYQNLKMKNNPGLREDFVSGEISVARLYGMSPAVSFLFVLLFP